MMTADTQVHLKTEHKEVGSVVEIPLDHIYVDEEFNCRDTITMMSVAELAKSIKENGLMQPIMVQPYEKVPGKHFRIVMGHRRFKAHQVATLPTIKAIINSKLSDEAALIMNLAENIQRKELNIVEEAKAIEKLKMMGWSEKDVSLKLNKSIGWVQVRYMLLELPDEVQHEASANNLTQSQIRTLHTLQEAGTVQDVFDHLKRIKDAKLTGKVEPKNLKLNSKKHNRKKVRTTEEIFALQDELREIFGNGILTRLLAWCGAEIDDLTLWQAIKEEGAKQNKYVMLPLELLASRKAS